MKYCIGCRHLWFQPKTIGRGSEWTGSYTIDECGMSCAKGHWEHLLTEEGDPGAGFEKAMEKAETCSDYKDRKLT